MSLRKNHKGQSILEYALLIAVVIAALLIMQVFIKRGYQGNLKESADRMGEQYSPSQSTIYKHVKMGAGENQTITEEVATNSTMGSFVPGGPSAMLNANGTIGASSYSMTTRSAVNQTNLEESTMSDAATEQFVYNASVGTGSALDDDVTFPE